MEGPAGRDVHAGQKLPAMGAATGIRPPASKPVQRGNSKQSRPFLPNLEALLTPIFPFISERAWPDLRYQNQESFRCDIARNRTIQC